MPDSPNTLSQFWQELKRRKVIRVITVYAAAAFVILQLVEILAPSLRLPEWTMNLILVLLVVGFIIAVILSWIFDVHPEEGIVKTEPVQKASETSAPTSSKGWKIASYISFVVIVGLIVLNIIPRSKGTRGIEILDKSIAVLPFINDSPDQENEHFISGCMMSILDNLSKIKELRVINRASVDQYKNSTKSVREIAEELDVSYLIYARGQKFGNRIMLTVQLIDEEEELIWSNPYDRQITKVEDQISLQSEIARLIAEEINVIITPEEEVLMNKIPTSDLTAYEYWFRGNDEELNYWTGVNNYDALDRAEDLYLAALEHDPNYAQAYAGLASVYWNKNYDSEYYLESFLDSAVALIDMAISLDADLALAHKLKADYYYRTGQSKQAIKEYGRALELNPNDWMMYVGLGIIYFNDDLTKELMYYHKAASLNRGKGLSEIFRSLVSTYARAGFGEKARYYLEQALTLDGDSIQYLGSLSNIMFCEGNRELQVELDKKVLNLDSTLVRVLLNLGIAYSYLGNYEEALVVYEKYFHNRKNYIDPEGNNTHRIAYAYWLNGDLEKANYYFDKQMEYSIADIELGRSWGKLLYPHYDMAGIYATRGETEKAYVNLRILSTKERHPLWMVNLIRDDPLFTSIRDQPEFQQIVRDVEAKYQAEHERVRKWLKENDML